MLIDNQFQIQKEIESIDLASQNLHNFQNRITQPKPRLLEKIRETEIYLNNLKRELDYNNPLLLESNMKVSSNMKFPSSDIEFSSNLIPGEHFVDFIQEPEVAKKVDWKRNESICKKSQKANFKSKTLIEKKIKKNKMQSFLFLISTIFVVKNFIEKLRSLSFLRTLSKLKKFQFNLIGDKSYIKEEHSNFLYDYLSQKFGEKCLVFDPSMSISVFLDFLTLIALSYYFLMIPLHFTYNRLATNNLKIEFDSIAFYILVFDILREFNTAIYSKGKLVYSRWEISLNYLNHNFLFDSISLTPAFLLIMDTYQFNFKYFLILFYLKIRNFKKIITRLEQLLLSNRKFHHGLALIKLIIWIIFFTHTFACIWNGIGLVGDQYFENTWLKKNNLEHSDFIDQYLFSYYFVCVTMNTVGFGDISPTNKLEVCFCIVFIFLACGIFAYSINSIGIILTDISKQQDEYRKDLNTINDFMKKKKISFDLRMRIRKYLEYIKKENKLHEDKETGKTISKLSDSLREELLLEANGSILKKINFFSFNFSEETLRKTTMIMKEKRFTPGDIIFERGDFQESTLYIIKTGEVELLFGNSTHTCKKGDTFGEFAFFSGQEQRFSARSLDFTTTFAIEKNEFLSILTKINNDFEKFNEIKDKLTLYNDSAPLHSRCFGCYNPNHRIEKCPIIHYCPKKEIILNRFLYNYCQERGDYKRKIKSKKNNTFMNKRRNLIKALLFKEDIKSLQSIYDIVSASDEQENENEIASEDCYSLVKFEDNVHKMHSFESSDSQKGKAENYGKSKFAIKNKELIKEENYHYDSESGKSSSKLFIQTRKEDKSFSRSSTPREKNISPNKFFDMIDFDKLGFFPNYFPKNDVELILKTIELRRVNFLKRVYSKRLPSSSFHSSPRFNTFVSIHKIDGSFVQGGCIKINQRAALVNFREDQKKKEISKVVRRQLNLKKKFFKRIEESPEEIIKKYFRKKLRKNRLFCKKKFRIILKAIKACLKKIFLKEK